MTLRSWRSHGVFGLLLVLGLATAEASDLDGFWKHDEEPVWLQIETPQADAAGNGTVRAHGTNQEAIGRNILRDISPRANGGWSAEIFAARAKRFVPAVLQLADPEQMKITVKVGMFSRTVLWTRVAELPAEN